MLVRQLGGARSGHLVVAHISENNNSRQKAEEALLSVLAGDIFGKTPIWPSIMAFKAIYYAGNIVQPRRAYAAWQRRRNNIRPVDDPSFYNA